MNSFLDSFSAQILEGQTDRAIERVMVNPDLVNCETALALTDRLAVYVLTQAGAKYAGEDFEGPRRNHE